jgi:uncharacterized protein (TIGR02996 family)
MSEVALLQSIVDDLANAASTWLVLADWLEERGDPRFELVRLCHDRHFRPGLSPLERDDWVRQLLAAGVAPCVPAWTNSIGMKLVLIPAGKFLMGSPQDETDRSKDEQQHEVEITRPFYMGVCTVTQEQYEKVMGNNPSYFASTGGFKDRVQGMDTRRFPVENVSWEDAVEFCKRLAELPQEKKAGRLYRLPTEAEWEYACRGGAVSSKPFCFGDSLSSGQANFNDKYPYGGAGKGPYVQRTSEVALYRPNAFGLFDMHGNVWEWCGDWYGPYPRKSVKDPTGPATGKCCVVRGGSWNLSGGACRTASRHRNGPGNSYSDHGFRVVCVAAPRIR